MLEFGLIVIGVYHFIDLHITDHYQVLWCLASRVTRWYTELGVSLLNLACPLLLATAARTWLNFINVLLHGYFGGVILGQPLLHPFGNNFLRARLYD